MSTWLTLFVYAILADHLLTAYALGYGVSEANPIVNAFPSHWWVMWLKIGLLVALWAFFVFRQDLQTQTTKRAIAIGAVMYSTVVIYHVVGLLQIGAGS